MSLKRQSRMYNIDGVEMPSVTTILGVIGKPELVAWASKMGAEKGDPSAAEKASTSAAARGSSIHKYLEAKHTFQPLPTMAPDLAGYVLAAESFEAAHPLSDIVTEQVVFHTEKAYAGTLDRIVTIGGVRLVLDYKTITNPAYVSYEPYPEHRLQLEAYRRAWYSMSKVWIEGVAVVKLAPDGQYSWRLWMGRMDDDEPARAWAAFGAAHDLWRWLEKYKK